MNNLNRMIMGAQIELRNLCQVCEMSVPEADQHLSCEPVVDAWQNVCTNVTFFLCADLRPEAAVITPQVIGGNKLSSATISASSLG
jgi:hypothetical protein